MGMASKDVISFWIQISSFMHLNWEVIFVVLHVLGLPQPLRSSATFAVGFGDFDVVSNPCHISSREPPVGGEDRADQEDAEDEGSNEDQEHVEEDSSSLQPPLKRYQQGRELQAQKLHS